MKKRMKQKPHNSGPSTFAMYPVTLFTEDGNRVKCFQYCRLDEYPLSGKRCAEAYFDSIESALNHYHATIALNRYCRARSPAPLLLLSAPV